MEAAANDATARVDAFLLMINFGGGPEAITPENRTTVLKIMTYMDPAFYAPPQLPAERVSKDSKEFLYNYFKDVIKSMIC